MTVGTPKLLGGVLYENNLSLDHERQVSLVGAEIIINTEILEIEENPEVSGSPNRPARAHGNRGRRT